MTDAIIPDQPENAPEAPLAGTEQPAPAPEDASSSRMQKGFTPEQLAMIKSVQKKRLIIALIAGIVMAVMAFFAGGNLREKMNERDSAPELAPAVVMIVEEA